MSTNQSYYSNVNPDLLNSIPTNASGVIEIGCGEGALARVYRLRNPTCSYIGVELSDSAAKAANEILDEVLVCDVESPSTHSQLDLLLDKYPCDTLVLGDVLEHLRNPWELLRNFYNRLGADGTCIACIPNVGHWSLVKKLLEGRWDYADQGLLDITHLRFFTLDSAIEMFKQAGWVVVDAKPRILWPKETEVEVSKLSQYADQLGIEKGKLARDLSAFQWVIRAKKSVKEPVIDVVALGLPKVGGVTEARVDYPLKTLASLANVRSVWGEGAVTIPSQSTGGVFVLHRQFMLEPELNSRLEDLVNRGWILVADIDDDPRHWSAIVESDFFAYRAVHAVTTSTEQLADLLRTWNPNVRVFPNAIFELPIASPQTPKIPGKIRVFFGALNRAADWEPVIDPIVRAAQLLGEMIEFVIVHDHDFYQRIPGTVSKTFHGTLPHDQYLAVLATCDLAILPLEDTPFNRFKSDLKLIECCAAGVVPICSRVVYANEAEHARLAFFVNEPEDWFRSLLRLARNHLEIARTRSKGIAYVKSKRMHSQQANERERYYRDLLAQKEGLDLQRKLRIGLAHKRFQA